MEKQYELNKCVGQHDFPEFYTHNMRFGDYLDACYAPPLQPLFNKVLATCQASLQLFHC